MNCKSAPFIYTMTHIGSRVTKKLNDKFDGVLFLVVRVRRRSEILRYQRTRQTHRKQHIERAADQVDQIMMLEIERRPPHPKHVCPQQLAEEGVW